MRWWIAIYFLSCINLFISFNFSLPLQPAIHRMGNTLNILCPRCNEQKESQPYFIFHYKLSKISLDFIELINLKYAFKITLKTIIKGTSSEFHDGVQLNILYTLSSETLLLNWAQKKSLWRHSSLLNSKGNLNIQFN